MKFEGFEILSGSKKILISAPHAVEQTRDDKIKYAEKETGDLAKMLNRLGYPTIFKTENLNDDANWDLDHPYKQTLLKFCKGNNISFVLDLHQLSDKREMDFCLGTGDEQNRNLLNHKEIVDLTKNCAKENHFDLRINTPYSASSVRTVSGFCSSNNIPAMQLEINSKLISSYCNATQLNDVFEFITQICKIVEKEIINEDTFDKQCKLKF